jgi:hypothetical protein
MRRQRSCARSPWRWIGCSRLGAHSLSPDQSFANRGHNHQEPREGDQKPGDDSGVPKERVDHWRNPDRQALNGSACTSNRVAAVQYCSRRSKSRPLAIKRPQRWTVLGPQEGVWCALGKAHGVNATRPGRFPLASYAAAFARFATLARRARLQPVAACMVPQDWPAASILAISPA